MARITKGVLLGLLLSALFSTGAEAQTINAASCNASDVQTALNSVSADGTTVVIPAGTCTWSSTVTYNQVYSTTIQGQTTCTGTPASSCTDNTIITDTAGASTLFSITTALNKSFRLSGISFNQNSQPTYVMLMVSGRSTAVRLDHLHIYNIPSGYAALVTNSVTGVMDHLLVSGANNSEFWKPQADSWQGVASSCGSGCGDNSWATDATLGGSEFMFLEDSTINGTGNQGLATNDCQGGGRYVVRYNTLNDSSVQGHTTGHAGDDRGCRAQEFYMNTLPAPPGGVIAFNAMDLETGTAMVWGNTATNYKSFMNVPEKRSEGNAGCGGNGTYCQSAPPAGWGYCGSQFTGSTSAWDQNSNGPTGYACIDQVGRGKGDRLSGLFPNKVNTAQGNTIAWPRQRLEPVYVWSNTWSCPSCGGSYIANNARIATNRDIFSSVGASCSGSSCTTGVGVGPFSARPANCTTNSTEYPSGNHPGVGYWATDQNTLYVCTATNTWTAYYTPYTYPHPLTQGTAPAPPAPPSPPTNLQLTLK